MRKDILIGSIITVVILVLVSFPAVISEKVNPENEPLDNSCTREIYTYVSGCCETIYSKGFLIIHRQLETDTIVFMDIEAHTLNPLEPVYYANPTEYFYAPIFIGLMFATAVDRMSMLGIALGNIEWR